MRTLFYIEPVVFRRDPLMLKPWIEWIAQIMIHESSTTDFAFSSSPWLCTSLKGMLGGTACPTFPIEPKELLESFDFDRHAYGKDLYRLPHENIFNRRLYDHLNAIDWVFEPDIIVSFTQNRYIERVREGRPKLFCELGPLPRLTGKLSFFMDPSGHQVNSLLNLHRQEILSRNLSGPCAETMRTLWRSAVEQRRAAHPQTPAIVEWLRTTRREKRIVGLALQQPDWLTYEAAWEPISTDALLRKWASDLPEGWQGVPLYHPGMSVEASREAALAAELSNIRFAPSELSTGFAELFLPHLDAIATISSTVGTQALMQGIPVVGYGQSQIRSFATDSLAKIDEAQPLTPIQRMRLLAFLTGRYCHPFADCLESPGYFNSIIRCVVNNDYVQECLDFGDETLPRSYRLLA